MRKSMFIRKPCLLVVSALVLSILFNSIVYACSRIDLMIVALHEEYSEDRNSIFGGAGSNWNKPIGSYGSAKVLSKRFLDSEI